MSETAKLKVRKLNDQTTMYVFWCPGCQETHSYVVGPESQDSGPRWKFNGDMEKPSFLPSLKYPKCHLWVDNGIIDYGWDCKHRFRGKKIPLQEF